MPQPKSNRSSRSGAGSTARAAKRTSPKQSGAKPAAAKRAPARPASEPKRAAAETARSDATRDQLSRLLNPLDVVVLSREWLQEAFDDAVRRGRITRGDATELAAQLFERGRRTTDDLLADVEQLLGRSRDQLGREVDRARRAAGIGPSFPIAGYDDLTAAQVNTQLGDLTPAELRKVRDYERRNANRKSVLGAIEQKLK